MSLISICHDTLSPRYIILTDMQHGCRKHHSHEMQLPRNQNKNEAVQCRMACFVFNDCHCTTSVTRLLEQLSWPPLHGKEDIVTM